jgi:hypothetical protein
VLAQFFVAEPFEKAVAASAVLEAVSAAKALMMPAGVAIALVVVLVAGAAVAAAVVVVLVAGAAVAAVVLGVVAEMTPERPESWLFLSRRPCCRCW